MDKNYVCYHLHTEDIIEEWKDIDGYEGLYQVSNLGRIKSFHPRYKSERILKLHAYTNGYLFIGLHKNNTTKQVMIHRLVANAFCPNPNNLPVVMHLDDNNQNNVYTNLQWGTQKDNTNTPHHHETLSKSASARTGNKNSFYGKTHTQETKDKISNSRKKESSLVEYHGETYTVTELAKIINHSPSTIRRWLREKSHDEIKYVKIGGRVREI